MTTKFTKQHYNAIATTLAECLPPVNETPERRTHYDVAKHLSAMFKQDNPRFNEGRFLHAAGGYSK